MTRTQPLLIVSRLIPQGGRLARSLIDAAPTVTLAWEVRCRSRFDAVDSAGRRLGVFLPRGTVLRGADVLVAEDGSLVVVRAAPEPVLTVRADRSRGSDFDLLRAAYHLGNRHVQLELAPGYLRLEPDHVLADMLRAMGLDVEAGQAPFEPEAGAYAGHGTAMHGHGHGHGHGHDHRHAHGHPDQQPDRGTPASAGQEPEA